VEKSKGSIWRNLKNTAPIVGIRRGDAIQIPIIGLYQCTGIRAVASTVRTKVMEDREHTIEVQLERCTAVISAAELRCSIEIAVGTLNQRGGRNITIFAVVPRAKTVECGQLSGRSHLEYCATAILPSELRGAIKISVVTERQPRRRTRTIRAIRLGAEVIKSYWVTCGGDLE
jgi:hypothetical protein